MGLDDDDVRAILQLLDASAFDELQVRTDRFSLILRRADSGAWTRETQTLSTPRELLDAPADGSSTQTQASSPTPTSSSRGAAPGTTGSRGAAPAVAGAHAAAPPDLVAVYSPLPGTFYRSPKPGAPPFVDLGTQVERDTVVAIVETMKLMNSI